MRRTLLAGLALVITVATAHAQTPDCGGWNSPVFSEIITVAEVERCLAAGHAADERDENGVTPLHLAAAWNSDPGVAGLLLDHGAGLEALGEGGVTPLHGAALLNGNPAVTALLLDRGANLEALADYGMTPLHLAVGENGNPAVAALLLDRG